MRLEIIDHSSDKIVETYSVSSVSMLDFQEWEGLSEKIIPLTQLLDEVIKLNGSDPVTNEPHSIAMAVDFYLPAPIEHKLIDLLVDKRATSDMSSDISLNLQDEISEQVRNPLLKVNIILAAVVEEISSNHLPKDAYKVRISE
ncbi:MAG: hypothetical protein KDJ65_02815 [Anaerolineae bacterium]|nr:hypothetical protein [Anaerolineae bacterium]